MVRTDNHRARLQAYLYIASSQVLQIDKVTLTLEVDYLPISDVANEFCYCYCFFCSSYGHRLANAVIRRLSAVTARERAGDSYNPGARSQIRQRALLLWLSPSATSDLIRIQASESSSLFPPWCRRSILSSSFMTCEAPLDALRPTTPQGEAKPLDRARRSAQDVPSHRILTTK